MFRRKQPTVSEVSEPSEAMSSSEIAKPALSTEKKNDSRSSSRKKKAPAKEKRIKRLIRYRLQLISLPLILVYYEVILMLVRRSSPSPIFPICFALGLGLVLNALLACLPKKAYLCAKGALIGILAVVYILECLIRSSFQQYMPYNVILHGVSGIAKHYAVQAFAAFFAGLPVVLLYLLPLVLFILCYKKWRLKTYQPALKKLLTGGCGALLFLCTLLIASFGGSSSIYKESYSFNNAVQKFGLLTGARLDVQYALFGNKYQSDFVITEVAAPVATPAPSQQEHELAEAAPTEDTGEAVAENTEIQQEQTFAGPTAFDELNIIDIDFDALIAGTAGDEVLQQMHQYVSSLPGTHKNNYTGAFAGKNLIMITAEALSDCAIDPNLTPTLYQMANNGFRFEDFYQPSWGGSTSTGEFSFVTGIIPCYGEQTILETQNNNLYFTPGNALQRQGYFSRAFHNGDYEFYNRYLTHQNLGYSEFVASLQGMENLTGHTYPADTLMFDKTLESYVGNTPFSTYYMTLSGHSDYIPNALVDQYLDIVNQFYGDRYMDTTKYYLCYQMELDRAMNLLITRLYEAGIADNTVIAICPDHYPYGLEQSATFGNDQDYLADLYGYVYNNWWELDHSVGIIWSPCMEKDPSEEGYVAPATISGVSYSIDMVPTLLNLFGIEYDSRLLPGRDCLDPTTEGFVIWENHSWLTDYIYHDSSSGNNYLNDGSGALAGPEWNEYIAAKSAEANNKIMYSGRVVTRNYFGVLFGEDTNF
ncbi:MAG: LTA synthase family protein [Lachnospiraceae bacterium]|nr:LTA synthase family protein [Lachnospiraceae bacterium]